MEERDHGSGPASGGPGFEQPAFEPTPEDIGRAAAEAATAAASAEAFDAPAPGPNRRPRRWLVTAGVAAAALALAGTATAIATGGSHKGGDTTENAAAAQTAVTSSSSSNAPTSGTSGDTPATGSPTPDAGSSSTGSPTPDQPPTTSSSSSAKPSTAKSSSPTPPAGTDEEDGGDCENTSHSTQQDDATKFSGMNRGAQHAFLAAQSAAKADGVSSFVLNSGYRSAAYQQRIFDCWVKELGSPQAARKYALPPNESAHVQGYAMDIAPPAAATWLENTKGEFGLCRRYADETWHFEYQSSYKTKGCPALLPHP